MTGLLDALLDSLTGDSPVREVWVGVHWTVVCSRFCGLAATLQDEARHGHGQVRRVGRLHELSARQLAEYARSENPLEASLGVAALNSLIPVDAAQAVEINAADVLAREGAGRSVALVGHFPFVERLREVVGNLWVIEQRPVEGDFPAGAAADLLPQADLVAITGSALVNHTLEDLLALPRPGVPVMVLGPSTPLTPVLFDFGVSLISGAQVVDEAAVLRTTGQGAGFRQVEGVRLLTFSRPPNPPPESAGWRPGM